MGNNEVDKPIKTEKPTSPPPEPHDIHVYPDWAAVQAYNGAGAIPLPYFNQAVASGHAAHPYMWAPPQMMAPYGSPYAAMYSHAGVYGPSAATVVATPLSLETPARSGNDSGSGKTPKESDVRASSATGNSNSNIGSRGDGDVRGQSQSTECGTAGSCDRSDDSTAREDDNKGSDNGARDSDAGHRQMDPYPSIDAKARNGVLQGIPFASSKPLGSTPMSISQMNYSSSPKAGANGVNIAAPCAPRLLGIGIQDERELKREKRKQSNRESARRSRLRKQAEMEELGKKVDSLTVENMALRSEINKLVKDSEKLRSDNAALMEKLNYNNNERGRAGEMASDKADEQEIPVPPINTENLLTRVDTAVANGEHEQGGEEK